MRGLGFGLIFIAGGFMALGAMLYKEYGNPGTRQRIRELERQVAELEKKTENK